MKVRFHFIVLADASSITVLLSGRASSLLVVAVLRKCIFYFFCLLARNRALASDEDGTESQIKDLRKGSCELPREAKHES